MGGETTEMSLRSKSEYPQLSAHPVGQLIPSIYKSRIAAFTATGQYEGKNLMA